MLTLKKRRHNILVLGAGGNAGLNIIKCFQQAKHPINIHGSDIDKYNFAQIPCESKLLLPFMDKNKKTELLLDYIKKHNIDYIHAQPDLEVKYLLENYNLFKPYIFPHRLKMWEKFSNKLYCQKIWDTHFRESNGNMAFSLKEVIERPELFYKLKGAQEKVWVRQISGAGSRASLPVNSLEQAISWATYWVENKGYTIDSFMLYEFLPGEEFAVQTFWINGKLIQSQARKRLIYFFESIMPSGQSSTPAVAVISANTKAYETAYKAIKLIDPKPHGIYCVDLKEDKNKMILPMEVNYGRFFTTSDFFATLGVNTPLAVFDYVMFQKETKAIESIKKPYHWLRGIDRDPTLILGDDHF
jgi:hypothetical protein